jgi:hypothetical protein
MHQVMATLQECILSFQVITKYVKGNYHVTTPIPASSFFVFGLSQSHSNKSMYLERTTVLLAYCVLVQEVQLHWASLSIVYRTSI